MRNDERIDPNEIWKKMKLENGEELETTKFDDFKKIWDSGFESRAMTKKEREKLAERLKRINLNRYSDYDLNLIYQYCENNTVSDYFHNRNLILKYYLCMKYAAMRAAAELLNMKLTKVRLKRKDVIQSQYFSRKDLAREEAWQNRHFRIALALYKFNKKWRDEK